ncbi:MAG: ASKHA domain-containing protein [Anaerovoracaceae bacterium]
MFKCTGLCKTCGKCKSANMISKANDRKTKIVKFPDGFEPAKDMDGLGVAFDIGTTTVVGMLWDLCKGKQIGVCAKTNPQNEFGLDVISRITYCGSKGENLDELRANVVDCLNEIINQLCDQASIKKEDVVKCTVCGNTTMSHIFAGYPPMSLAQAPFDPAYTGMITLSKEDSKLDINADGKVVVLPNIAGHVGGDITSGIVASRLLNEKGLTVFIDIGTNGEIVLTKNGDAYACSTAAGPAFEGSAILHGMRAAMGAIEKIEIKEGEVFFKTIGECQPEGICGSGLIDAIAQMLDNNLISKTGRMISAEDIDKKNLDHRLKERLIQIEGERRFVLVFKEQGEDIVITQNDIREVQLAKAAISAGITLMLEEMGETVDHVTKVMVAGAFGSYINKESAVRIGILPTIDQDKIISAGNTAGAGVCMTLTNENELVLAESVPNRIKHIELAGCENFQNTYLNAMAFSKGERRK